MAKKLGLKGIKQNYLSGNFDNAHATWALAFEELAWGADARKLIAQWDAEKNSSSHPVKNSRFQNGIEKAQAAILQRTKR